MSCIWQVVLENLGKPLETPTLESHYSKMKYTYDSFFRKESPSEVYSWNFPKRLAQKALKNFIIDFESDNNVSIAFHRSFHSFLTTGCLRNKNVPSGKN